MTNQTELSSIYWLSEELEKWELGTSQYYSKGAIVNHAKRLHKKEITEANNEPSSENYYQENF